MKQHTHIRILALQCAVLLLVLTPVLSFGAESSSFKLYTNTDESDQSPLGSDNYALDEAGGTWTSFPLTGSTFQIVTAPPEQSSSSSSSSSQSTGGTSGGGGTGGSGANPNAPRPGVPTTPTTSSSSSSEDATSSSESSESSAATSSVDVPVDANLVPKDQDGSLQPSAPDAPDSGTTFVPGTEECTGNACVCECPVLAVEDTHCAAETKYIEVPIPVPVAFNNLSLSILLLIIAYLLGYSSRSIRSGQARIPNRKAKKTTKRNTK